MHFWKLIVSLNIEHRTPNIVGAEGQVNSFGE